MSHRSPSKGLESGPSLGEQLSGAQTLHQAPGNHWLRDSELVTLSPETVSPPASWARNSHLLRRRRGPRSGGDTDQQCRAGDAAAAVRMLLGGNGEPRCILEQGRDR